MRGCKHEVHQPLSLGLVQSFPQRQSSKLIVGWRVVHGVRMIERLGVELSTPRGRKLLRQRLGGELTIPTSSFRPNELQMSEFVEQGVVEEVATDCPRRPLALSGRSELSCIASSAEVRAQADPGGQH